MSVQALLSEARSLRLDVTRLMESVGTGKNGRALEVIHGSENLDAALRAGGDPSAILQRADVAKAKYGQALAREQALEGAAEKMSTVFGRLQAAAQGAGDGQTIASTIVAAEIRAYAGAMAALGQSVQAAILETGVAAALSGAAGNATTGALTTRPGGRILIPSRAA